MTEDNYFCWSTEYNSYTSFQQPRYRVFNVEVWEKEYNKIKKIYHKLEFDKHESYNTRFKTAFKKMWYKLSKEKQQEYLDIPHFSWEWFTYITWIKKDDMVETIEIDWKKYNKSEVSERLKELKSL